MILNLHPQPPSPADELGISGYPALLADHCQLVDQVANLTVSLIRLWEAHNALLSLLDMPRIPLPIAASAAVAARPAVGTAGHITSTPAGKES